MKPPTTLDEQLGLLTDRGLVWADEAQVRQFLYDNSYYRFSGYLRYYQHDPGRGNNRFRDGSTFEQIQRVYLFDDELRRWLFDGVCIFEVTFRARFAYELAHGLSDPGAYLNVATYSRGKYGNEPEELVGYLKKALEDSKEPYIARFVQAEEPVPVWAAIEVCSFGTVSKMFELIKDPEIAKPVAKSLGLPFAIATGTVQSLSVLRNVCAHHGRIWNRILTVNPPIKSILKKEQDSVYHRTPWAWIVVLGDLVDRIQKDAGRSDVLFSVDLRNFLDQYPDLQSGLKDPRRT
ncbi:Abi family protein [Nocardia wallacei]|uniref:Abi family protein n=1 Tax=Nocardia wallacei TaxID=480035 RepID=UPI0024552EAE|nr:Abi family protein [Nocardia wallacei]